MSKTTPRLALALLCFLPIAAHALSFDFGNLRDRFDSYRVRRAEPCVCTMQYAPVCGLNGNTYSNSCLAHCSGMMVMYEGACGTDPRAKAVRL